MHYSVAETSRSRNFTSPVDCWYYSHEFPCFSVEFPNDYSVGDGCSYNSHVAGLNSCIWESFRHFRKDTGSFLHADWFHWNQESKAAGGCGCSHFNSKLVAHSRCVFSIVSIIHSAVFNFKCLCICIDLVLVNVRTHVPCSRISLELPLFKILVRHSHLS